MNSSSKPLIAQGWLRALLFFIFFLAVVSTVAFVTGRGVTAAQAEAKGQEALWRDVGVSSISAFICIWVFRKWIDRKSIYSLGFTWSGFENDAATGLLAALAMLGLGSLFLVFTGHLRFSAWGVQPSFLVSSLLLMLLVAFSEEIIVRGYLLNNLMQSMNKWFALFITAALFSFLHLNNKGIGILSLIEIFVGGVMLGINYIFTRNLWFGIALHFAWNFFQGPILGYPVSGVATPALMQQDMNGPAWLTGGIFGLEGSVVALVLNTGLVVLLTVLYQRQSISAKPALVIS